VEEASPTLALLDSVELLESEEDPVDPDSVVDLSEELRLSVVLLPVLSVELLESEEDLLEMLNPINPKPSEMYTSIQIAPTVPYHVIIMYF